MYEVRCCFRVWCWWEEEGGRIEPSIDVAAAPRRPGYVEFVLDVDELLLLFDHENIVSILKLFGIVVCVRCKYHETYCNIQWNGTQSKFDIGSFERKNLGNSQNIMFPVVIVDKS